MGAAMAVPAPRTTEKPLVAGTTLRFAVLIVLLLVSSGSMMWIVTADGLTQVPDAYGCLLAAGGDPVQGDAANAAVAAAHNAAYESCQASHNPVPAWWVILVWPLLLVLFSSLVFRLLPRWKARRARLVPLSIVDRDGEIGGELSALAARVGLPATPRVLVAPAKASTSALVFGSNRRPWVCLHGGLLVQRAEDPERFQAVVLHEFAHIRGGDVTLTYVTVALWRVFLAVVLLPFVAWYAANTTASARSPYWHAEEPGIVRQFVFASAMVALVYLARSDVLRSREIYADLAAGRYGASRRYWALADPQAAPGGLARGWNSFTEIWRTHPRWEKRREAFDDPKALFTEGTLPTFLAGAAALLITSQLDSYLGPSVANSPGADDAIALAGAVVVAGIAGLVRWRAVLHALQTDRRVTSGTRTGLSLGVGMTFGALISSQVANLQWLPTQPEYLLLVVLAGTAFAWWTTQCAHLWLSVRRGRTVRWTMAPVVVSSVVVLWGWFAWWQTTGVSLAVNGTGADRWRLVLEQEFPGPSTAHQGILLVIAVVWLNLIWLNHPIAMAALVALCAAPLSAWFVALTAEAYRTVREQFTGILVWEAPRPPLRRLLIAATLGGVVGWIGAVDAMAFMHTWQASNGAQSGLFSLIYLAWVFVGLAAGMIVASAVSVALGDHRFSLVTAVIVTEAAALLGFAGWYVLAAADGCLGPLNTMATQCEWRPGAASGLARQLVGPIQLTAPGMALASVTIAIAFHRATSLGRGPVTYSTMRVTPDMTLVRRIWAGVVVSAVLGAVAANGLILAQNGTSGSKMAAAELGQVLQPGSPSPRLRTRQIGYWYNYGGLDIMTRWNKDFRRLSSALTKAADTGTGQISDTVFPPLCTALLHDTQSAKHYFPVPEPGIESQWASFIAKAQEAGRGCLNSFSKEDGDLFLASMKQFARATDTLGSVEHGINAVIHPGKH
ncbi:M48 family metalloprotease [Streptomyces sp. NPDC056910]|uniref:M48 family metalloprotease n=1 Tax=Streptomyces sp. NPDC056910 TaxID=3345964 RepID=UPI00369E4A03